MFTVADIAADAKRVLANCDDATLFNRLNYAIETLANESDWDPLVGVVDICTDSSQRCLTLPREVEVPLAVNISGSPAQARNRWFSFHLNGPGDDCRETSGFFWDDKGNVPIVQDPPSSDVQLVAFLEDPADTGAELWVYGFDQLGRWVRTDVGGTMVDGSPVPTIYGYAVPNPTAPRFSRITRVRKSVTRGYVRLTSFDFGTTTGTLLGDYAPDETEPSYRRLKLSRAARWVRLAYRRSVLKLKSMDDLIPLHSPFALLMALKGLQKMEEDQLEEGSAYLTKAVEFITKEQLSRTPLATPELQVRGPFIVGARDRLE